MQPEQENALDEARRHLQETFCGAVLWFDGLLGGNPDLASARSTSGRVELSTLYSDFHGLGAGGRLNLRYQLPTVSRRLNLFLGRSEKGELIQDREEGFALRSSTLGRKAREEWLSGLGYTPPGKLGRALDVRAGLAFPETFAQMRLRMTVLTSDVSVWRLRETVFWRDQEGFGSTTALDYDRVLTPRTLFHWSNRGTVSEASEGVRWRSALILYHGLGGGRATVAEAFALGSTSAEVPFQEFGIRGVYRQRVFRPFLYAELVVGNSWPRYELGEPRTGAPMIGLGAELLFGRNP